MVVAVGTYAWDVAPTGHNRYMYLLDVTAGGNWYYRSNMPFKVHGWSGSNAIFRMSRLEMYFLPGKNFDKVGVDRWTEVDTWWHWNFRDHTWYYLSDVRFLREQSRVPNQPLCT